MLNTRIKSMSLGMRKFSSSALESQATQISTLANGFKVATESTPGHFSALGLYVNAGSRYENYKSQGLSHIMDRLAFKSTEKFSGKKMMETLELLGGNFMCASARESLMYQASVFNPDVEKMFELLAQTIRYPAITEEEIYEQKITADYEIGEIWKKPDLILPELLHMAAYQGETLGSPLLCPKERLDQIDRDSLIQYRKKFFKPENIVAAFVGVEHETALELANKYFGSMKSADISTPSAGVAKYIGGTLAIPRNPPDPNLPDLYHIQFGFEGLPVDHEDIYALATLQTLLGGGGSFSAGGPGKGMYSRLYSRVLNRYGYLEHCQAFNHSYTDSGLFGITVSCLPEAASYAPKHIIEQFAGIFSNGKDSITDAETSRAKNQLKSSLLMNLESKMVELEDLGRQVQVHGKKIPVEEMVEKIDRLTTKDVKRVAETVLTGNVRNKGNGSGKPTVVVQGELQEFGDMESLFRTYGLGKY